MERTTKNTNSTKVLSLLIKKLQIPVTDFGIESELEKYSHSSNLLAISEALDNWNIPNSAYPVSVKELIETEIPLPFIACLAKGEVVLVIEKHEDNFIISNDRWNDYSMRVDEFTKYYQGTILAFQKEKNSGESGYTANRRKEIIEKFRTPFVISGSVIILMAYLLLSYSFERSFTWLVALLILFKSIGLISSVMLLIQSIDSNNPLIQKLCSADENKNCNAVLSSKAAKITEELSWSEVGFFYFTSTWMALLFNYNNIIVMQWLALFNLLCLPYTFYSVYYQWRIAKQWCVFCCTVLGILWLEFVAFLPYLHGEIKFDLRGSTNLLICLLVPILLWVFIKPYLISAMQIKPLRQQLYRFKYNTSMFKKILEEGEQYKLPKMQHTLVLGNPEAEHVITMVTNPFCRPCSSAHKVLDELINNKDDVKLQLVFSIGNNENSRQAKVAKHLLAIQNNHDELTLHRALNDWYAQKHKDYDSWAKNYPSTNNDNLLKEAIEVQKSWCKTVSVTSTPTLFVNGRRLPAVYRVEDIKYVL